MHVIHKESPSALVGEVADVIEGPVGLSVAPVVVGLDGKPRVGQIPANSVQRTACSAAGRAHYIAGFKGSPSISRAWAMVATSRFISLAILTMRSTSWAFFLSFSPFR